MGLHSWRIGSAAWSTETSTLYVGSNISCNQECLFPCREKWLARAHSESHLQYCVNIIMKHFSNLGLCSNQKKSYPLSTEDITFIEARLQSTKAIIAISKDWLSYGKSGPCFEIAQMHGIGTSIHHTPNETFALQPDLWFKTNTAHISSFPILMDIRTCL